MYHEAYKFGMWALRNIYRVNTPFLIMFGKEDKITSYKYCREYFNNTGKKTKHVIWDDAQHNLHNSQSHIKIHQHVIRWIEEECLMTVRKKKADEYVQN